MARRQHITLILVLAVITFLSISYLWSGSSTDGYPVDLSAPISKGESGGSGSTADLGTISDSILKGGSIAPKLGNETAKAELGRASWKLLHTMMARFPEEPSKDDSVALKTYIQLFARLYPCGECAAHFRKLLDKYPPQTSSRNAAAGWACFVHNQVNKRLKKPEFNCAEIGDFYDCGCGEEDKDGKKKAKTEDLKERSTPLSLEKEEGLTRGG